MRFTENTKEETTEQLIDRDVCDGQDQAERNEEDAQEAEILPIKKHSSIFHNALRPNSAVRQLFPAAAQTSLPAAVLTHEALRAFEEAKRPHIPAAAVHSDSETDTIRRTIERNALRRSLIKYEPK